MKNFKIKQSITDRQDLSLNLYFKDVSKLSMLSLEEETELARKAKNGDEKAIQKLVTANLRFVISVAKQYQGKGLPLVDLIQEGSLGCLQAARLFDPDKGFRFISYAVWWIRQSIIKAISDHSRIVRVPMSQIVTISKINKVTSKFEQLNGREPSVEEITKETNIESDKINSAILSINKSISLEKPLNNDEVNCLIDVLPNENVIDVDNAVVKEDVSNSIELILSKLSYRDRDVLRMSFGIGMYPMPNEEIAKRFGIGSERVRQILHKSINYIRKNYSSELKKLL